MTIKSSKFYGGYKKVTVDAIYRLSALHPRFIRFICMHHEDSIYLPKADELPIHTGGASFTLWNEGYHNCIIKDYSGNVVGCLQGTAREPTELSRWTSVHLIKADKASGTWWIDSVECVDPPDLTVTETWCDTASSSFSSSGSWGGSSGDGHSSGYSHHLSIEYPNPLPFPRHPEIPIPQRRPKRAAEGI